MDALLIPGTTLGLFGLLLIATLLWSIAGIIRPALAILLLRNSGLLRPGDLITIGGCQGRLERIDRLQLVLRTQDGETIVVPGGRLTTEAFRIGPRARGPLAASASGTQDAPPCTHEARGEPGPAASATDEAIDPDWSLPRLQAAHEATRRAIADLAEFQSDAAPQAVRDRTTELIRRLARIESLMDARS